MQDGTLNANAKLMKPPKPAMLFIIACLLYVTPVFGQASPDIDQQLITLTRQYETSRDSYKKDDAYSAAKQAYELAISALSQDDVRLTMLARNHGEAALRLGNTIEARNQFERAVAYAVAVSRGPSVPLVDAYLSLVKAEPTTRDAIGSGKKAIKNAKKLFGEQSAEYIDVLIRVGTNLLASRPTRKARQFVVGAYEIATQHLPETDPMRARATYWRGRIDIGEQRYESAIPFLLEAAGQFETSNGTSTAMGLSTHALLIEAYERTENSSSATEHTLIIARASTDVDDKDIQPIFRVAPSYPKKAVKSLLTGFVRMEMLIDIDGRVVDIEIIDGENTDVFADAAKDAVRRWRFSPRIVDGKPLQRKAQTMLKFEI
ncbi:MAG: TonB family protein [Woeseiaceae bacterium]